MSTHHDSDVHENSKHAVDVINMSAYGDHISHMTHIMHMGIT